MVNGLEINIPENIDKIISFSPAITETLFMLGYGDKIIADSAFCSRPEDAKNKRKLASYSSTRLDVVKELNPDIILTIGGYQEKLYNTLRDNNIKTYIFELPSSMHGILELISRVGIVVNKKDESRELEYSLMKYEQLINVENRFKTYFEIDLGGPVTFGSMSYITDSLYLMGFSTIYRNEDREWISPDFDYVKKMNPDVFIYEHKMYRGFSEDDMHKLIKNRGWENISAVKKGNVFITPGKLDFFAHHGPSFYMDVIPWSAGIYNKVKNST